MERTAKVITCIALLCMIVVAPHAVALSCGLVFSAISPCISYLLSNGSAEAGSIPGACCSGVRRLDSYIVNITEDLPASCFCLRSLPGEITIATVDSLKENCGLSNSTACSTVT